MISRELYLQITLGYVMDNLLEVFACCVIKEDGQSLLCFYS